MTSNDRRQAKIFPSSPELQPADRPRRGQHRQRDFGIGYGNSSGYGSSRRYASDWSGAARFRCS